MKTVTISWDYVFNGWLNKNFWQSKTNRYIWLDKSGKSYNIDFSTDFDVIRLVKIEGIKVRSNV